MRFLSISRGTIAWVVILLGVTLVVWWPVLTAYFWLDDFALLQTYGKSGLPTVGELQDVFLPPANAHYRPAGWFFWRGSYLLFGDDAVGYHALNLLIIANCGILVRIIGRQLGLSTFAAGAAGVIYVAHPVLIGNAFWVSTMFDNLANLFSLATVVCVLGAPKRRWLWLVAYTTFVLALLSKESALVVPVILLTIPLAQWWTREKPLTREWWPIAGFFVVLVGYIALRELRFGAPWGQTEGSYAQALFGMHLVKNAIVYGGWFVRPFFPQETRPVIDTWYPIEDYLSRFYEGVEANPLGAFIALALWLTFLAAGVRSLVQRKQAIYLIAWVWLIIALLPAMPFQVRSFEWYASMALPGFALMAAVTLNYVGVILRLAALGLFVAASVVYVQDQRDEHYVMRGQSRAERIVRDLTRVVPNSPPQGALILFWSPPGFNFGFQAIEGHYGPQFLYQDFEVQVFDGSALRCDEGFWVAPEGWYPQVRRIDPERTIPVLLSEAGAVRLAQDEVFPPNGCDPG